jgi:ribosomal protein S18 acetylase RimI-like enzyme
VPKPGIEDYRPYIERGEVWILEAGDEPIGVIVLEEKSDFLLVYSVAVKPRHQRNGHATTLLGFADQHALAIGVKAVRLYTNQRMERNIGLYRRCGFTEIAKRPHPSRPGEVLVDMEKTMSEANRRFLAERIAGRRAKDRDRVALKAKQDRRAQNEAAIARDRERSERAYGRNE